MYLLEIDQKHNRVHITLADHFTEREARALLEEFSKRLGEISNNCHVLCDLSCVEQFDLEAKKVYRQVMDLCNENGTERVVRIFDDPMNTFGMSIMSYFHYDDSVKVKACNSYSQALRHLKR